MPPTQAAQGLAGAGSGIVEEDRSEQPQGPRDRRNPLTREFEFEPRGAFAIVNEAFAIYFARFKSAIALNAIAQLPVAILTLLPLSGEFALLAVNFISTVVLTFAAVATIYLAGQHYATGNVIIGVCYARTLWRGVSILTLGVISAALATGLVAVAGDLQGEQPETVDWLPLLIMSAILATMILVSIYLTLAGPAVMFEGRRGFGMLRRGILLARGSEFRVIWNLLVYGLTFVGMTIVIMLPFGIAATALSAGEEISVVGDLLLDAGQIVLGVLVTPIIYIAFALLYFDLRTRKEDFTLSQLRREMGVAAEDDDAEPIQTEETQRENPNTTRDG